MTRGPLAVVLSLLVSAPSTVARADDPTGDAVCVLQTPAPKGSARLRWQSPDGGEGAPGFWISDGAMVRLDQKREACVDQWAMCQRDLAVEKGKVKAMPGWKVWMVGIGIALTSGIVIGKFVR